MWVFTVFGLFHTISAISFVPCADIPQVGLFTQSVANYSNVKDANDSAHIILKATLYCRKETSGAFHSKIALRFEIFHVPNGTVLSGCTDPTQATARLVIVLVSRIQKSGTGDNNFVK